VKGVLYPNKQDSNYQGETKYGSERSAKILTLIVHHLAPDNLPSVCSTSYGIAAKLTGQHGE
jgi:hypothetical protein